MKDNQTQWGHAQKNRLFLLRERLKSLGYTVIHSYRDSTPEESLWFLKRGDNFGTMWWAGDTDTFTLSYKIPYKIINDDQIIAKGG